MKSAQSKESLPSDNAIIIALEGNKGFVNEFDVQSTLDLNAQYNKERNECTKYRIILTLNPYCTNVLCNPTSTIIEPDVDSSGKIKDSKLIVNTTNQTTGGLGKTEMTKRIYCPYNKAGTGNNTIFSLYNPPLKYRLGYDIFDNVYFRTKSIRNGKFMDDSVPVSLPASGGSAGSKEEREYAFVRDEISGYKQAIERNLSETNGWIQCLNPSRLLRWELINGRYEKTVECVIPYAEGGNCEKTDMFPTREMFQFDTICRYENNYLINEENWKYFLTYPYKNFYDHWLVSSKATETKQATVGIPIIFVFYLEAGTSENIFDRDAFKIQTAYPNKLKQFDKIRIYTNRPEKINDTDDITEMDFIVQRIVNETTFYILSLPGISTDFFKDNVHIYDPRLRKVVNGVPCDYYIRQFRKLPNWKFENEQITLNNIKKKLETNNLLFNSTKYRLAYGKNNFDDKISQIIFTDSVDINLLEDNLGRPLGEIYLTICKNNESKRRAWKPSDFENKYFHPNNKVEGGIIPYETEFQRYWSKNSVGFELVDLTSSDVKNNVMFSSEDDPEKSPCRTNYPNIYCMHNLVADSVESGLPGEMIIKYNDNFKCGKKGTDSWIDNSQFKWTYPPNSMDDIDDDGKLIFYGDICEFDRISFKETTLSRCQHRFNTVNRESKFLHDTAIVVHGIALFNNDDIANVTNVNYANIYDPATATNTFKGSATECINGMEDLGGECDNIKDNNNKMIWRGVMQAGPRPEGYYHQAHHPITFKWYENELRQKSFGRIYPTEIYDTEECTSGDGTKVKYIVLFTEKPHRLLQNSIVKIMWTDKNKINYEKPFSVTINMKDTCKMLIPYDDELYEFLEENGTQNIIMYNYDHDTPLWAKYIGYGSFVWRNILTADSVNNNPNMEFPFVNGHFYIHKQINFFLRRQSIGCPSMLFTRMPADVSPNIQMVDSEKYEDPCDTC